MTKKGEVVDCIALARLERPGGGFIEPGVRCKLEQERAEILIGLGLARVATKDDPAPLAEDEA